MELQLKIIGALLIILSFIHVGFPAYFNWKKELASISLVNRQMMWVHTFFIALFVLLTGLLCISAATDLIETRLGNRVSLGLFIFWVARLLIQLFGYSPALWKGKLFETFMHVFLTLVWVYLSVVFFIVYRTGSNS